MVYVSANAKTNHLGNVKSLADTIDDTGHLYLDPMEIWNREWKVKEYKIYKKPIKTLGQLYNRKALPIPLELLACNAYEDGLVLSLPIKIYVCDGAYKITVDDRRMYCRVHKKIYSRKFKS